jgi:hypothetical protein
VIDVVDKRVEGMHALLEGIRQTNPILDSAADARPPGRSRPPAAPVPRD